MSTPTKDADTRLLERMLPPGANPADYVIGSTSGLPKRRMVDVKDADADTLLNQLAVIAGRAVKLGGALPPDMAERLNDLADAARRQGPVITHPTWCDRALCFTEEEQDGTIVVGHERVILAEYDSDVHIPGMEPRARVQVVRFDNYAPNGTVDSEGACMCLDVPHDGIFHGVAASRFTRAVAVAGELIAGDQLPPDCRLWSVDRASGNRD